MILCGMKKIVMKNQEKTGANNMKKTIFYVLLLLLMISQINIPISAETYIPSRVINLVYDDSGSMIRTNGTYVDTWCQAKYAMEVFAAMLGEKDTLNIYYMSDYVTGTQAKPKISLGGSADATVTARNVNTIHELVTDCSDTPFNAVKKAYADLKAVTSDERWLVVLTDGEFNETNNSTVENHFHEYVAESGVKIMMLSMGPNAALINSDPENNIFFEKAVNTKEIPGKLTGICNRIFQSNALPLDKQNLYASFNVPMTQLIVFAQGKNVSIGNIKGKDGTDIAPNSNVSVSYSTVATIDKNYPQNQVVVADNLMGYVATFDTDFEAGDYKFNVTGTEDIQVYYKPNVSIAAYLYDGEKEVTAEENLVSGTYRLEFGFVNGTNGEKVTDTSLLGNIAYQSEIINKTHSGEELVTSAKSGDTITIKEGTLDIDVTASFLEYNTVNTKLSYQIYSKSDLIFAFEDKPVYTLNCDGFKNPDDAMILTVKISDGTDERPLTPEQWELLEEPKITTKEKLGDFRIEKTEEIGKYFVYPTLKDNDPMETATGKIDIIVSGGFTQGLSAAQGEIEDSFQINNEIGFLERVKDWLSKYWKQLLGFLTFLFLLFGYIPPFKKYLPKKIKKRPLIECRAEKIGMKDTEAHGKYQKSILSTLIPYKAETGFVTFSPSPHKKTALLKGAGGHGMYVMNVKSFAGKDEFAFNGMAIEEGRKKPYRISGGSTISLKTQEYLYTCYLNR